MHTWIEFSQTVLGGVFFLGFAMLLLLALDSLARSVRSWWANRGARSPEEQAVDARYQGSFHLPEPGLVRRRFARRYGQLRFHNHWACVGRWRRYE